MGTRPESDEALVRRLLPSTNPNRAERARAWAEWQMSIGETSLLRFIRAHNNTSELDEDILQESMLAAYLEVERGAYQHREGVPFTAYVKGIARNKLREARRRGRDWVPLDDDDTPSFADWPIYALHRQLEATIEHREVCTILLRGLSALPGKKRQVLERYLQGERTAEIAASLSITEDLVRQHKCRGLRQLRVQCTGELDLEMWKAVYPRPSSEGMWAGLGHEVPACPDDLTPTSDFDLNN